MNAGYRKDAGYEGAALHNAVEEAELDALNRQWPRPLPGALRAHHQLEVDHPFLTGEHQMLVSDGRRAEICYIMHRGKPEDGLLLHIKTIYPDGAYRLPTGGIHQGETVLDTLHREVMEETGLRIGSGVDAVELQHFLGVQSYAMAHRTSGITYAFATYFFLMEMPVNAKLVPQDPSELICGWQWCPLSALGDVAQNLATVGQQSPVWGDWGRYRALGHRFVQDALQD